MFKSSEVIFTQIDMKQETLKTVPFKMLYSSDQMQPNLKPYFAHFQTVFKVHSEPVKFLKNQKPELYLCKMSLG